MGARLDGPSTGALLMEVSWSGWQQQWSKWDGVGLGRAMLCLLCWPAVRTTLILAAVSSRSSLPRLVSGICSSAVVVWYSCSSLHSGGGILSSSDGCQSLVITTTTFVNKRFLQSLCARSHNLTTTVSLISLNKNVVHTSWNKVSNVIIQTQRSKVIHINY